MIGSSFNGYLVAANAYDRRHDADLSVSCSDDQALFDV
jgi:hypothetical protein